MTVINTRNAETINIDTNGTYDVARYTTANVSVGGSKYALLSRVKDDSDNDIGCVVGFHTDANNQKYAVVCLNKYYRPASQKKWLSSNVLVTGLATFSSLGSIISNTDTATSNCDKILEFATENNLTSEAVNECRSKSFVIDGTTYYGQLPNYTEALMVLANCKNIYEADPSQSGGFNINALGNVWSSTQRDANYGWALTNVNLNGNNYKTYTFYVFPILEIPIQ